MAVCFPFPLYPASVWVPTHAFKLFFSTFPLQGLMNCSSRLLLSVHSMHFLLPLLYRPQYLRLFCLLWTHLPPHFRHYEILTFQAVQLCYTAFKLVNVLCKTFCYFSDLTVLVTFSHEHLRTAALWQFRRWTSYDSDGNGFFLYLPVDTYEHQAGSVSYLELHIHYGIFATR